VLSVFTRCKARVLALGEPDAAWITATGMNVIGKKP
jgi:hypothetical protein